MPCDSGCLGGSLGNLSTLKSRSFCTNKVFQEQTLAWLYQDCNLIYLPPAGIAYLVLPITVI